MNTLTPLTKLSLSLAIAVFSFSVFDAPLFGGVAGPPGNGGLQIVFSDDGNGKTAITASGSGQVDDDLSNTDLWLGFSDESPDRDFIDDLPTALADLAETMGEVDLDQTIELVATGDLVGETSPATITFNTFAIDSDSVPGSGQNILFFSDTLGMGVGVAEGGAVLSVSQGNGLLPLPYSTFSALYGQSFPSTDGFTFVFSTPPSNSSATPGNPAVPDLQIGKKKTRLKGDNIYDRRAASNKQTLVHQREIFSTNSAKAALLIQNDGGTAAEMKLSSSGDHLPRMKVRARAAGSGNITADLKRSGFSTTVPAGGSVAVSYKLTTNRFFAGVTRNGDRDDTINFKLSSNGEKDNAAMIVKYRE